MTDEPPLAARFARTHPGLLALARWLLVSLFALAVLTLPAGASQMQNPYLFVPVAAEIVMGWVVVTRRPENPVGWIFLGIGALAGLLSAAVVVAAHYADGPGAVPWWGVAAAWWGQVGWYPLLYLLTTLTILLYPQGLPSPRWRPVLWVSLASLVGLMAQSALAPHLALSTNSDGETVDSVANPLSSRIPALARVGDSSVLPTVLGVVLVACTLLAVVSAVIRTRRATGVERLQMRWFTFAVVVLVAEIVVEPLVTHFLASAAGWLTLLEVVALSFIPIACGVAITRYHLYDIDRIISRTTSYVIVSALVVSVYLGVVALAARLTPGSSSLAVAAATLTAAAVARPLVVRVRGAVDRRFDRAHYDAERTIDDFGRQVRLRTDGDALARDLVRAVDGTVAPSRVALWLRE